MLGAFRTPEDRRWYRGALVALVAAAWLALAVWGASPHALWLGHHEDDRPSGRPVVRLGAFTVAWTLMTVAMMLPGSLPVANLFGAVIGHRPDRRRLMAQLGAGYLAVWAAFGLAASAGDLLVHAVVGHLTRAAPLVAPLVVLAAGGFQFTSLKHRCLTQCRSPYLLVAAHWRGVRPQREAWSLGVSHGLWCVGCCWALMLLMFAVGVAHLGWMLALGAVMAAERATTWGRRITRPVGAALVAWGALLLAGIPAGRGL